ncbi:MAG: lysophospholipid acyltransferase family protein [Candidatus Azotimanducaceae bacterium]|uniref:Lipid A biosynthesis acyltransferase n=1 Tax=OM182 bacterium TaxID=2510334 RepID=A0A520S5J8_9GAMM|nr:lipid A biosynthesis acyltransferase [Gammaproteobacteria bacterium]OUV68383.1 MAG: hypothetical protein CBC93_01480 [Gammaproteobacteria bacterium TMED133]RZO77740.1 MAG: lipid A biosynthesis acyltransferase [OM182 bacterium]
MTSLVIILLKLIALCPRVIAQALGKFLGWMTYITNARSAVVSRENLNLCYPQLSKLEQTQLLRESLVHTAQTFFETPSVWLGQYSHLHSWIDEIEDESLLIDAINSSQGVIVLLPHLGNWELFNIYFARHGSMTALYHPPRQTYLKKPMQDIRLRFGNEFVPTTNTGLIRLFRSLNAGGVVTILPDQVPARGIFSDFFGQQALTDLLIPRLLRKTGAVAVAVSIKRRANGRFTLICQKPDPDIYHVSNEISAKGLNKTIEACVALAPAQYQWEYKRFRERPAGEQKLYRANKLEEFHS